MPATVAVVEFKDEETVPLRRVFDLIGGIADLNVVRRSVVLKVGVFSHKEDNHASIGVVDAVASSFNKASKIFVVESDNYRGTGSERLQIWKQLYSERVTPFNLSTDSQTRTATIAGQQMKLSHLLFKPNVLISMHILRSFESGSILKNLFGCIPDSKRKKHHQVLPELLADVYEAIGGVDLAVLDGTFLWSGAGDAPVRTNTVLVGRDAVAVEVVGATLAGLNPATMPVVQEFVKRGLGEGSLGNIKVVGASFEALLEKFSSAAKVQKKRRPRNEAPRTWGGQVNRAFKSLVQEGFFKQHDGRTIGDVIKAIEVKGLIVDGKQEKILSFLSRRVANGSLKKSCNSNGSICWKQ